MKETENGTRISRAPWDIKQVWALNERQNIATGYTIDSTKHFHPYTCSCGDSLLATMNGWWCESCKKIVQTWAYESDAVAIDE